MRQAMCTLRQVSRRQHDSRLRHNEGSTQADPPPGNPPASGSWAQAPAPLWAPATWCEASWSSRAAPLGRWRALQEGPGRRRECAGRKAAARRHRRRRAPAGPAHSLCCAASAAARTTSLGRGAGAAARLRALGRTLQAAGAGRRTAAALCIAAAILTEQVWRCDRERAGRCQWLGGEGARQGSGRVPLLGLCAPVRVSQGCVGQLGGPFQQRCVGWRRRRRPAGVWPA